ncbi:MAG TPA: plasmid stabilization protein [Mycoplana sp.]|jgi:plasmid stability protein|nr:plasmid stabilization protein [Mycoplana sp.]
MGDLLVRNIPDAMKRELAEAAERAGISMSDKAKDLLRRGLQADMESETKRARSGWDALRPLLSSPDGSGEELAQILGDLEARRKEDFGRPVEIPE